ncbi:MAG: AAA family ATPase [Candidatus Micrarchaeia archaeon]
MLIIICGLPGSGKTSLARALANKTGAAHISSDLVRKGLFPKPAYTEEEKLAVYARMEDLCREAIGSGKDAVVDATFYRESIREGFLRIAREGGTRSFVILCELPEAETEKRLGRRRRGGPSDADFGVYLRMKKGFEPIKGTHLRIDSMAPMRRRLEAVKAFVGGSYG